MVEKSIINAIRYGRAQDIRGWLETHKGSRRVNNLLLRATDSPNQTGEIIKMLLEAGADPNYIEVDPTSIHKDDPYTTGPPLHFAARKGNVATVKLLVEAGANLEYSKRGNYTVINYAAFNSTEHLQGILEYLISLNVTLDTESEWKESALSWLSHIGRFDMVQLLLNAGASISPLGWDDLMRAIALGTVEDCRKLLEAGASVNVRDLKWKRTPFLLSVQVGDIEKSELLLKHGAKLDDTGHYGKINIMYALREGNIKMLEWLIAKGADVNQVNNCDETALMKAAEQGLHECADILLKNGADVNDATGTDNRAINRAANIETVRLLVDAGADINRKGGDGYYLLKWIAEDENHEFIQQLLELGAKPDVPMSAGTTPDENIWGETALQRAVQMDDVDTIKLLLEYGADPNIQDVDEETPLHLVSSAEAAEALIKAGGDPYIKNMVDHDAFHYAQSYAIVSIFMEKAP